MSRFSDYLSSQITPQMTLLEKFNLMIKFLQENNYISIFYSKENYNVQTESYQKEKVNLNGFTLHIGDCIVFSNGYYAFVETIGVDNFTIGNVLYFQGEQGVSVVGATISSGNLILTLSDGENVNAGNTGAVSYFSIDGNQHLIVHYQNGTTNDLGAIFSGNINISGNITVSGNSNISGNNVVTGNISGNKITGNEIIENDVGFIYTKVESANYDYEYIYAGAVKNGNKLTIVIALNLTKRSGALDYSVGLGNIYLPQSVYSKLYPTNIGQYPFLDVKEFAVFSMHTSSVNVKGYIEKTDGYAKFLLSATHNMVVDTKYYVRYEVTFLLSDNLVS